jgi:hypothetical protein
MTSPTLFFCFGLPKSGTTFLQRLLNSHPQISCPSEQQFDSLHNGFQSLFKRYNDRLRLVDRRTGGQGATLADDETQRRVFKSAVEIILAHAAGTKPVMGVNDNGILNNLGWYGALFGAPKMIAIFRNPLDAGLSAWHHNHRLAREEGEPGHVEMMMRFGGLDGWLLQCARYFSESLRAFADYSQRYGSTLLLRYEDLSTETAPHLGRVLGFLGVGADEGLLDRIVEQNSLATMKLASSAPGFYRSGSIRFGAEEVGAELRSAIHDTAARELSLLGYDVVNQTLADVAVSGREPLPWVQA